MRRIFAVLALAVVSTASFSASPNRKALYAKQLDCATQKTLAAAAGPVTDLQAETKLAVDACVTSQDMAAVYRGFLRNEDRNPETLHKEMDERKAYLAKGVAHRIASCSQTPTDDNQAASKCTTNFKGTSY